MNGKQRYGKFIGLLFSTVDLAVLNICYFVTLVITGRDSHFADDIVWLFINLAMLVVFYFFGNVHKRRVLNADIVALQSLKSVLLHAAITLSASALVSGYDIGWRTAAWFYGLFTVSLTGWWVLSKQLLKAYRTRGFNYRRVVVIGGGEIGSRLVKELTADASYGYRILGFFDDNHAFETVEGYRGTLDDVEKFVQDHLIDEMYCAVPDTDKDNVTRMMRIAERNAVDFYYVPQFGPTVKRQFELYSIGNVPLMAIRPYPLSGTVNRAVKRTFDIIVSLLAIALILPFFPFIALGIKLSSPGPIFFTQKRTGYRGREFDCLKFLTMRVNDQADTLQATKDDPRKTAFGNLLRKTNIDELPQFINVLLGDMSIVGPRPHMVRQTEEYSALIDKYMLRHTIKPGITGWAQVNGYRGQTEELWQMEKRVEYDVWYAENWNFMLDLKIMVLTIVNTFRGDKNAF